MLDVFYNILIDKNGYCVFRRVGRVDSERGKVVVCVRVC